MREGKFGLSFEQPAIGASSRGSLSYADILRAEGQGVPAMMQEGNYTPKPSRIPYKRYIEPRYVDLERDHLWRKHWQVACREEDLPNVGDRLPYDVGDLSFLLIRSAPDTIRAFYNSCPHRSRMLCTGPEAGEHIRCPFHGWTWALDGKLVWVVSNEDFVQATRQSHSLIEVKVARWGGNVFINPAPNAPPLEAALGPMVEMFADFPLDERYTVLHIRKRIRANWKAVQEAFMEAYHTLQTHWDAMPFFGSTSTQYDVWDDGASHLSRLVTPSAMPDKWVEDRISPRTGLISYCTAFQVPMPPPGRGETLADARAYVAETRRKIIEDACGTDLSGTPNAMYLDMTKAYVFPNHHPWWGEAIPWWYRFTPIGRDPDQSLMELRVTQRVPKNGPRPKTATPIDIDFDERVSDYEDQVGSLGYIVDQDVENLVAIQRGFKAAAPDRAYLTLGSYQENAIQHFHDVYAKALGLSEGE